MLTAVHQRGGQPYVKQLAIVFAVTSKVFTITSQFLWPLSP